MNDFIKANNPHEIHIVPTFACNKRCEFCYQKCFSDKWLDINKLDMILKEVKSNFEPRAITFQGGEITLKTGFEYYKIADKYFPQTYRKSLTTNGYQTIEYYKKLKEFGISHISFSYNQYDRDYENKIKLLSKDGFYNIRINTVIYNNEDFLRHVFKFAKRNNIQLTFCEDLTKPPNYDSEKYLINILNIKEHKKVCLGRYDKIIINNYLFWICKYTKNGRNDSLIILPNGNFSMSFNDLIVGIK